ncbi:MAG: ABC transporter ATP-binding protein [Rubrobacteraceae bacterium]
MLEATDYTFVYPGVMEPALRNLTFSVSRGEVLGLVGPIGAGKTSLCMSLGGFVPGVTGGNTSGKLEVGGKDPREISGVEMSRLVGMVFEDYTAQLTQIRVIDEIMAPLLNRGFSTEEARGRADELMETVRLSGLGLERKKVWELSGGQQQRVAIAAMLAMEPELVIFDSATGMLDPQGKEEVRKIVKDLAGERTLIVSSEEPGGLVGLADSVMTLVDGELVTHGSAEEVLRDSATLSRSGVDIPVALNVAEQLELSDKPLTAEEFKEAAGSIEVVEGEADETYQSYGEPLVQVEDAVFRYPDGTAAVQGVDLVVRQGESHAIIGGNGAGKSTLGHMIVGLSKPAEGSVTVAGVDTRQATAMDLAWHIGTTFQNPDEQISEQTVRKEISFPLNRRRYKKTGWFSKEERYDEEYIEERIAEARGLMEIDEDVLDYDPVNMPRGQRRLINITQALALDPKVLFLDEPIVGLDAPARGQVRRLIATLKDMGKAVIIVDHDLDLVCETADTITVLNQGRVALQGPKHEVFARENWDLLAEMYIRPPRVARLAEAVGTEATTERELVARLSPAETERVQ